MDEGIRQQLVGHFIHQIEEQEREAEATSRAWLIERVKVDGTVMGPAQYIGEDRVSWTTDHLLAIRFCRREDAERAMRLLRDVLGGDHAIATEHMWG